MTLAQNLKRIRTAKNMSQTQLAIRAGVSQQSISRLEKGEDQTTKNLPQIAAALGVSLLELDTNYTESIDATLYEICTLWDRLNDDQKKNILNTVKIFSDVSSSQ